MATVIHQCFSCDNFWTETLRRCPECGSQRFTTEWDEESLNDAPEDSQESDSEDLNEDE